MTKKERFFSLKAKMVAVLLTALVVGTILFQLTGTIVNTYIEQVYLSEEACAQRIILCWRTLSAMWMRGRSIPRITRP